MSYLNVIPDFSPLPAVHGLGNARMIPLPPRGFGQTQGCPQLDFSGQMGNWIQQISLPGQQTQGAVGCGPSGGDPCTSPDEASQMAMLIAEDYCSVVADGAAFNCPSDPACANLDAATAPYIAQALKIFQGFDPSIWATEAANLKSGQSYGSSHSTCPAGTFPSIGPNGMTCSAASGQGTPPPASQGSSPYIPPPNAPSSAPSAPSNVNQPMGAPVIQSESGPTPAPAVAAPDPFAFLTQSMIGGIPNWGLIVAGVAALFLLGGKR